MDIYLWPVPPFFVDPDFRKSMGKRPRKPVKPRLSVFVYVILIHIRIRMVSKKIKQQNHERTFLEPGWMIRE